MASDDDFFALRRFDRFHVRILLLLQDRVTQVEEELDQLDRRLSSPTAEDVDNGTVRDDKAERLEILDRGVERLAQYGKLGFNLIAERSGPEVCLPCTQR